MINDWSWPKHLLRLPGWKNKNKKQTSKRYQTGKRTLVSGLFWVKVFTSNELRINCFLLSPDFSCWTTTWLFDNQNPWLTYEADTHKKQNICMFKKKCPHCLAVYLRLLQVPSCVVLSVFCCSLLRYRFGGLCLKTRPERGIGEPEEWRPYNYAWFLELIEMFSEDHPRTTVTRFMIAGMEGHNRPRK